MTMALILSVPRRLDEGAARAPRGAEMGRLVADLDARPPDRRKAPRHRRHGADRHGRRAPRQAASASPSTTTTAAPPRARLEEELEATYWESLDQMLARVDIVSVNCPATPATYHLLSRRRLKLMREGARHREHRARLDHRRGGADRMPGGGRDRRRRPRRLRARAGGRPELVELAKSGKRGAPAAHGLRHARSAASTWARR